MAQRISGLSEVDPLSVPLPHGTEVTTRVERMAQGRRLPQGVVGRVVRARDGGFDWEAGSSRSGTRSPRG